MRLLLIAGIVLAASQARGSTGELRALSIEERVEAQRAIETVYWRHRTWPQENASPKPSLDTLMPRAAIQARVEEYLRKSAALESLWHRPITSAQLQAEIDRMARHSQDRQTLRELFAALHDDPVLIAETLARPGLVERLIRAWHANDAGTESGDDFDSWWQATKGNVSMNVTIVPPLISLHLPSISTEPCTVDSWTPTHLAAPDGRYEHTAVWTGSEMIVWGGNNSASWVQMNTGGRYSPATDSWEPTSRGANVPSSRYHHTAVWTGTEMVVWGGHSGSAAVNDGGRYDPTTDSWQPLSTGVNVPSPRGDHSAVWTGSEMIVWGGFGLTWPGSRVNTGARYNPATNTWATMSTATAPSVRSGHVAVWTGTEMIIFGATNQKDGARYAPLTDSWSPIPSATWLSGSGTAVWTGTEMIVWGGNGTNTGGRYNPTTNAWTVTSTSVNCPSIRDSHSAVWTGSEMLIWGGGLGNSPVPGPGGRYNPSSDTWQTVSMFGSPSARSAASAVWTGTEMIIWGGSYCIENCYMDTQEAYDSGGRYNPTSNSWIPTLKDPNIPVARTDPTSVWTGVEMIVWGGRRLETVIPTLGGGRYVAATDSWQAMSHGVGAPNPRYGHSAVWTGTEMIVWGGVAGLYFPTVGDGSRYNPLSDTWTPVSLGPNSPHDRMYHTALWTGSEMLVWGGTASSDCCAQVLNSGGLYNPRNNEWRATSTGANAPAPRWSHAAVWTGTEMIVWGGYKTASSPATAHSDGARYSPATNTWLPVSTAGAPIGCANCASAWTGQSMIVWGGDTANTDLGSGGRYSPLTDSWDGISSASAPGPRVAHTAVWTGQEFVVWGGTGHSMGPFGDGARYNPMSDSWSLTSAVEAPLRRYGLTSAWTGREMIVWGGYPEWASSARYCACPNGTLVFRDADGDGYGDTGNSRASCDGSVPSGFVTIGSDCNDASAAIRPGATETCDGIDNDCNGYADEVGASEDTDADGIRELCDNCRTINNQAQSDSNHDGEGDACDLDDGVIYVAAPDKTHVAWQAETGFTSWNRYRSSLNVLRATGQYTQAPGSNAIAARTCGLSSPDILDAFAPSAGDVALTLVTGVAAGIEGNLGTNSAGAARPNANPCP